MPDNKKLFVFGDLNPIEPSRTSKKLSQERLHRSNLFDIVREASIKSEYGISSLEKAGPFYAIVLKRIDNTSADKLPIDSAISRYITAVSSIGGEQKIRIVKARIPELHAHIPDPFAIENLQDPKNRAKFENLIEAHPTFVGEVEEDPQEGMLVLVDFQNRTNLEGPILLSVAASDVVTGPNLQGGARSAFGSDETELLANMPPGGIMNGGRTHPDSYLPTPKEGATGRLLESFEATPVDQLRKEIEELDGYHRKLPELVKQNMMQTLEFVKITEAFWKQMYPNVRIDVKSCIRDFKSRGTQVRYSAHGMGLAADVDVVVNGKSLPVDLVYVGYLKLIEAGILPNGGLGIYVNVKNWKGWGGPPSKSRYGAGGSSWIHYDWRGFTPPHGNSGYKRAGNARWLWIDVDGDGKDEIGDSSGPPRVERNRSFFKQWPEVYELRFTDRWKLRDRYTKYVPEA